jgi:hypothetical protein
MKTGQESRIMISVLGISHQVQGVTKGTFEKICDPSYRQYIETEIDSRRFDFVFEEASGLGPTIAEDVSLRILGKGHYLDVDPSLDTRPQFGIPGLRETCTLIHPSESRVTDGVRHEVMEVQDKREKLWVDRVKGQSFTSALFICGYLHMLSLAFRLQSADFFIEQASTYVPHHKLCALPHA